MTKGALLCLRVKNGSLVIDLVGWLSGRESTDSLSDLLLL